MAKRRTPPLFEVLSGPARRPGPGGYGARVPIEVRIPGRGGSARGTAADAEGSMWGNRRVVGVIATIAAVVLVLVFGVWVLASEMAKRDQQARQRQQINDYLDTVTPAPATVIPTVRVPGVANPSGGGGAQGAPEGSTVPGEAVPAGPRLSGNNYLHVVTLVWKDAQRAVAYLEKNGVPAAAVPAKAVDPLEARAKNLPHLVFALEAIPSEQYRATERRRQELIDRVRRIGKKWQSEERGPSDFGEPMWAKYK